ncbi:chitobiase/beta-hexosaminidase C-terminal domain-containing protein [Paenibacillus sp. PvR148]
MLISIMPPVHVNRANAMPIEHELTFSDRAGIVTQNVNLSAGTKSYEHVVGGSLTHLILPEGLYVEKYREGGAIPLLWGSNLFTIRAGESDIFTLTVHRGAKSPDLHSEYLHTELMPEKLSTITPTEDGGLIAIAANSGYSELYKMNEFGKVTAMSRMDRTELHDVFEISPNQYLVFGVSSEWINEKTIYRPFAAVYKMVPGELVGGAGSFQLVKISYFGQFENGIEPVSVLRMDSTDEYLIAVNRVHAGVQVIEMLRFKMNANSALNPISRVTIAGSDSYTANKVIKARGSDKYLIVGKATDRITNMSYGLVAHIGYDSAAGTLSLVNDFGTGGLIKSSLPNVEYVSAATVGENRYVLLGTREALEPDDRNPVRTAELAFIREDGSSAAESKSLPELFVPTGHAALASTPDGGFIVGGRTKFDYSEGTGGPIPMLLQSLYPDPDVNKAYLYKFGASLEEQWKQTIGDPGQMIDVTALYPLTNGDIWVAGGSFQNWGDYLWDGYAAKLLGPATLHGIQPAGQTYVELDEQDLHSYLDDTHLTWKVSGDVNHIQGFVDRKPGQTVRVGGELLPEGEMFNVILSERVNRVEIEVTAADQHTKKRYTLDIIKSLPGRTTVIEVTYNGTPLTQYNSQQTFYMPVTSNVYQADLHLTLSHPAATFDIDPTPGVTRTQNGIRIDSLPYGKQLSLLITVTSPEYVQSYWKLIIGSPSNEAELKRLYAQPSSAVVEKVSDRYTVTVPDETSRVVIHPSISDFAFVAHVAGAGFDPNTLAIDVSSLQEGSNLVTVVVQAQSGVTRTFVIEVIRGLGPSAAEVVPSLVLIDNASYEITLSSSTADAAIYYTVDGSDLTLSSALYDPLRKPRLIPGYTLKAIAVKQGMKDSPLLVLTAPNHEYPGSPDISYVLGKIKDRVDVDGGGFGPSDVEFWLGKIKPVKVVPVLPAIR